MKTRSDGVKHLQAFCCVPWVFNETTIMLPFVSNLVKTTRSLHLNLARLHTEESLIVIPKFLQLFIDRGHKQPFNRNLEGPTAGEAAPGNDRGARAVNAFLIRYVEDLSEQTLQPARLRLGNLME
jgi:hypothetical protein